MTSRPFSDIWCADCERLIPTVILPRVLGQAGTIQRTCGHRIIDGSLASPATVSSPQDASQRDRRPRDLPRVRGVGLGASLLAVIAAAFLLASQSPRVLRSGVPVAAAQDPGPVVATFQGSYDGFSTPLVLGPVTLHPGLVIVRGRHQADKNFVVNLRLPDPGAAPTDVTVNTYLLVDAARYDGAAAVMVPNAGDYYLLIAAGGEYELIVEQPTPTTVAVMEEHSVTGRGQQVTAAVALSAGPVTVAAEADVPVLLVWLYAVDDGGGRAVADSYNGRAIDTGRGTGTTVTLDLPADGLYLLAVETPGRDDAPWTLTLR